MTKREIAPDHFEQLRAAKNALENPGLAIQLTNLIGWPVEKGVDLLPEGWRERIVGMTRDALEKAASVAVSTIRPTASAQPKTVSHKIAASLTGAAGGAFGLPALAIELPISTTIMLRSIAEIARCNGEDLADPESRIACVEVFALGGRTESDDQAESAYFVARGGLGRAGAQQCNGQARGSATAPADPLPDPA